jgi:hypothetical protein
MLGKVNNLKAYEPSSCSMQNTITMVIHSICESGKAR